MTNEEILTQLISLYNYLLNITVNGESVIILGESLIFLKNLINILNVEKSQETIIIPIDNIKEE